MHRTRSVLEAAQVLTYTSAYVSIRQHTLPPPMHRRLRVLEAAQVTQSACFTSTKVQILTLEEVWGGQGAQVAGASKLVRARAREVCVHAD
jgi:hypothetical protein